MLKTKIRINITNGREVFKTPIHFMMNTNEVLRIFDAVNWPVMSNDMNDVSTRYLLWKELQPPFLNGSVEAYPEELTRL